MLRRWIADQSSPRALPARNAREVTGHNGARAQQTEKDRAPWSRELIWTTFDAHLMAMEELRSNRANSAASGRGSNTRRSSVCCTRRERKEHRRLDPSLMSLLPFFGQAAVSDAPKRAKGK